MRGRWIPALLAFAVLSTSAAWGYAFLGSRWKTKRIVLQLQLGGSGGQLIDGAPSWNAVAETAAAIWNEYIRSSQFYVVRNSTVPIRDGDGFNSVFFDDTVFGFSFGGAVAVTTEWRNGNERIEADVVVNRAYAFNSYRGPLRRAQGGGTLYDLRRVLIHEFGHVLGLDHPDKFGQFVRAIMNSSVSDIDTVLSDDIAGAQALYGRNGASQLAEFKKPGRRYTVTNRRRFTFRGTAKSSRVTKVYLVNDRISPRKAFPARGLENWRRTLRLKPGINRISIYVDTGAPKLKRVKSVRMERRRGR